MKMYEITTLIKVAILSLISGIMSIIMPDVCKNAIACATGVLAIKMYSDAICRHMLGINKHVVMGAIIFVGMFICAKMHVIRHPEDKAKNKMSEQIKTFIMTQPENPLPLGGGMNGVR